MDMISRGAIVRGVNRIGFSILAFLGLMALEVVVRFSGSQAQGIGWSAPVSISDTPNRSWFPDLAVDGQGNVHVVWCETTHVEGRGESEQIFYTRWDGHEWSAPNDIVAPQFFIHRNAIAVGPAGDLFMVFRNAMTAGYGLLYTTARASQAWSAGAWSPARLVGAHLHNYMADLAVDGRGTLHLIFDDMGEQTDAVCLGGCADIYYRYSIDNGRTWSAPLNLSHSDAGSGREQLKIDGGGTIHATWDEGWDRLSGAGVPTHGVYRSSSDGGLSWSDPVTVTYPATGTVQLTAGADGRGGVMLVWRNISYDELFYQWSADYGESWSTPSTIPEIFARPWTTPFDVYDMASDSAGLVHLLVVGRRSLRGDAPLGVYHLVWDGERWSSPVPVYAGAGFPEYPRLEVNEGNHLHAVWFVRDDLWAVGTKYNVWYSDGYSVAPHQTPAPSPTPTATPTVIPTATPKSTATAYPTLAPGSGALPTGLNTESDDILRLLAAIAPVLFIILLVVLFRRMYRGNHW